eukprot:TRINITY_DN40826_c0_g1_i1.p1 TRINITY_DN40826_c0_g1~~TRINITY_DN40826_c0_g1_i1.p1  ORF type:complete len:277 (+),score=31.45 TRINITY_DN40826_c0_g1_i1:80-910(+)
MARGGACAAACRAPRRAGGSKRPAGKVAAVRRGLQRKREGRLRRSGARCVIGADEAGRGPIAGPVVAAACHLPQNCRIPGVQDSKLMREAQRNRVYDAITRSPGVRWAVAVIDAAEIDRINILQAALLGMRRCVAAVMGARVTRRHPSARRPGCYVIRRGAPGPAPLPAAALVDGPHLPPGLPCRGEAVVRGDGSELSIAAASVIAKVTRDRLMLEYDTIWPQYGLKLHKGYPTAAHIAKLRRLGPCPIHRRSFGPVAQGLADGRRRRAGRTTARR